MLIQPTLDALNRLKLHGMALGLSEQMTNSVAQQLGFEERVALLLDREVLHRENRRMGRLLRQAQLKLKNAVMEDLDYRSRSGLDRPQLASLTSCDWIRSNQNLLIQVQPGAARRIWRAPWPPVLPHVIMLPDASPAMLPARVGPPGFEGFHQS